MYEFYGLDLYFAHTEEYFGVCTEDEEFWLFKIKRKIATLSNQLLKKQTRYKEGE